MNESRSLLIFHTLCGRSVMCGSCRGTSEVHGADDGPLAERSLVKPALQPPLRAKHEAVGWAQASNVGKNKHAE